MLLGTPIYRFLCGRMFSLFLGTYLEMELLGKNLKEAFLMVFIPICFPENTVSLYPAKKGE